MSSSEQDINSLVLEGDCTIYEIADLFGKIRELVKQEPVARLDLSGVEKVDAAFLQLLLAAHLEAKRNNTKLEINGTSDVVSDMAKHIYLGGVDNAAGYGE